MDFRNRAYPATAEMNRTEEDDSDRPFDRWRVPDNINGKELCSDAIECVMASAAKETPEAGPSHLRGY